MNAPDKIYIQQDMINNIPLEQKEFDDDVEYIRKDVLLEWAEKEQAKCSDDTHPYAMFMNVVINKLNEK